jgi:predicted PurR-regulated permease PerM
VIVLALFLGAEALGILGALLAVPIAVIVQTLLDEFWTFGDPPAEQPETALPLQPGANAARPARSAAPTSSD